MDLQEIKQIWIQSDRVTQSSIQSHQDLLKEVTVHKVRGLLSEFTLASWLEHIINTVFLVFTIRYVIDNIYSLKFASVGLILAVLFAYDVFWSVRHLHSIYTIDFNTPVAVLQQKIGSFLRHERRERKLLLWMVPVFWVCFVIVCAHSFIGIDLFGSPVFLLIQFVAAAVVGVLVVFILKLFPDKDMEEAYEFLGDIDEFDKNS